MSEILKTENCAEISGAEHAHPYRVLLPSALASALNYRWLIFAVLAGGYVLVYFHRLCPAVVAVDMMRDLNTGGALLGLLGSSYFYPYAIMQLPAGLLADSWGARRTITSFTLIAFAGAILLGLSTTVSMAIFGRVLVGLGVSMLFVPTMKVLTEWFRPQEFAKMTGVLLAMGGMGSLISATPLAMMTEWLGWRMAFTVVAFATLALAILVWLIVRDKPEDLGWRIPSVTHTPKPAEGSLIGNIKQVVSHKSFWPLAGWFFFQSAVFFSFAGLWGGPYLQHVYGLERAGAGQILSLVAIGLIVGGPFQTWLSNRLFKGRRPVLILSSAVTMLIVLALVLVPSGLPTVFLAGLCLLLGMFTSASVVIGFSATKELFPVRIAGTSIGMINLFPFAGGAALQPVFGWYLQHYDLDATTYSAAAYQGSFAILLGCAVVALACSFFIKETMGKTC